LKQCITLLLFFIIILSACGTPVQQKPVLTNTPLPMATKTVELTTTPTFTPEPTLTPTGEILKMPDSAIQIPDTKAEFDQLIAEGKIREFDTQAELDTYIDNAMMVLPENTKEGDPHVTHIGTPDPFVFTKGDDEQAKFVELQFTTNYTFKVRDIVLGPNNTILALAEILLPNGTHTIIKLYDFEEGNNGGPDYRQKMYSDLQQGPKTLNIIVFLEIKNLHNPDPQAITIANAMPDDIKSALFDDQIPENIGEITLACGQISLSPPPYWLTPSP
jgi:hypothetical protein